MTGKDGSEDSSALLSLAAASIGISVPTPPSISIGDCLLLEHSLRRQLELDDKYRDEQCKEAGEQVILSTDSSIVESPSSIILCTIFPPSPIPSCTSPRSALFNDIHSHNSSDCSITRLSTSLSSPSALNYANEMNFEDFPDREEEKLEDESSLFSPLNIQPLCVNRNIHGIYVDMNADIFDRKGRNGMDGVKKLRKEGFDGMRFDDISSIAPEESITRDL